MLGALLGAGASLISGLFGRSDAKKKANAEKAAQAAAEANQAKVNAASLAAADWLSQQHLVTSNYEHTTQRQDYTADSSGDVDLKKMVADAEAAGFNPLTAMRSGLASAYARTHNTATTLQDNVVQQYQDVAGAYAADAAKLSIPSFVQPQAISQVPSIGSVAAGALSTGVSLYNDYANKVMDQNFQRSLQASYLQGVQNRNSLSGAAHALGIPTVVTAGSKTVSNGKEPDSVLKAVTDNNQWDTKATQAFDAKYNVWTLGGWHNIAGSVLSAMDRGVNSLNKKIDAGVQSFSIGPSYYDATSGTTHYGSNR